MPRLSVVLIAAALTSAALAACGSDAPVSGPVPATPSAPPPVVTVAGDRAAGLVSPWGLVRLPDGSALVSERDTGRIVRIARTIASTTDVQASSTTELSDFGIAAQIRDPQEP